MTDKWTAEEINHKMDWEGFDYFFRHYISPDDIADEEIKEKAEEYREVAHELEKLVVSKLP